MALQFIVPQFIDVEDKIIGPISVRQFVLFLVGGAVVVLDYQLLYRATGNFIFFILSALVIVALTFTFAFAKVNGQQFHKFLLNVLISTKYPGLRVWNKDVNRIDYIRKVEPAAPAAPTYTKKALTPTKLTQISLVVDTGGAYHDDENVAFDLDTINRRESLYTPSGRT
ncbi:MAG: PrgI family protein [Candidatus Kerfeldbacteria bacterium]|nr:PrgI family protein [Candidatus Kerfeldbacteria bacterium]